MNDILSLVSGFQINLYADDTILYCVADSAKSAVEKLQLSFNALQNALVSLKLVLNQTKTK